MKIDLPLWDKQLQTWRVVKAEPLFDIAPHLSLTFAVHRCPWDKSIWKVSDLETGSFVVPRIPAWEWMRRDAVIQGVRERLTKVTEADVTRAIRKLRSRGHRGLQT